MTEIHRTPVTPTPNLTRQFYSQLRSSSRTIRLKPRMSIMTNKVVMLVILCIRKETTNPQMSEMPDQHEAKLALHDYFFHLDTKLKCIQSACQSKAQTYRNNKGSLLHTSHSFICIFGHQACVPRMLFCTFFPCTNSINTPIEEGIELLTKAFS